MSALEWSLLILLGALWGSSFLFNKIALRELPHFSLVCVRLMLATTFLFLWARASGFPIRRSWRTWRDLAIMGFLNNFLTFNFTTYGQTHINAGLAAIIAASAPLFVVLLSHFLTHDEKMTRRKVAGVMAGIAGVAVIMGLDAIRGIGAHVWAQFAVLCSAVAMASAGIFGRRLKNVPPVVSAGGQAACSMLLMIPIAIIVDRPWELTMPGAATWGSIAGLAIIGSGVSYVLFFRLLATVGATNVILVNVLTPVSAVLLGVLFLGEHIELRHLAGMLMIAAGLATIDGRVLRWLLTRVTGR
ncbi:MAG: EamA family transporter [Betaproteobacteria bacterium]|nr:EamA family transporter [Betaproteobacteria bacterium]